MKKLTLVGLGFGVLALLSAVRADIVKLKNGAVLDGNILSEDDKQVTVEVETAGGSITRRQMVNKSNVVEIVRLTSEQQAERQMQQEYEKLKRYQLSPAGSFPLVTYNQVIDGVFRKFLTQYTNSPYEQEITEAINQWEAERSRVASGKMKYRGQWLDAVEGTRLVEQDRANRLLQLGRNYLAQGRYDEAIKYFHNLSQTGKDPQLVADARRLEAESYQRWLASLGREEQRINEEIKSSGERAAKAEKAKGKAETNLGKVTGGETRRMGVNGFAFEASRADSEAKIAQNQITQSQKQLAALQQFASELRERAAAVSGSPSSTSAQGASPSAGETTTVEKRAAAARAANDGTAMLDGIVDWVKDKWMFVAGGAIIGLWLIARMFTRS